MLIRGGRIVDVDGDRVADLRVGADGTVDEVGTGLEPGPREDVVDASGKLVVPGGVDAHTHVHLRVGGIAVSDEVAGASRAAAIGGTTTILEHVVPGSDQGPTTAIAEWQRQASSSAVDHGCHLSVIRAVDEQFIDDAMAAGVTSFKVSMVDADAPMVDDGVILDVLWCVGSRGGLVALHAENGAVISSLQRRALARGRRSPIEHALTRPPLLEGEATARAAMLAEIADTPAYILHVSSAPALEAVRKAQERGVRLTAETCPHFLHLNEDRLAGVDGADMVTAPPLREPWHSEELWYGLAAGWIHTVASDHCSWSLKDRYRGLADRSDGWRDFTEIPAGLPGVETRMALVWAGVVEGRLRASDWVRLCAEAPARAFGLWPRKGSLRAGADADVVVWDPLQEQRLDHEDLHMQADHSPYQGMVSHGWPDLVLLRGERVAAAGRFVGRDGGGRFLRRDPAAVS